MDSITHLTNVHIAGPPTFFPAADPNNHRCMLTVIKNRGKNKKGEEMKEEFSLTFWGKYAQTAAIYLDKGRCINAQVAPRTYVKDTGQVRADGKRILDRQTTFNVISMEFGGDTMKELTTRVTANIQLAKSQGLLPPDTTITADYLLKNTRPQKYDYSPELAAQTGTYGNARVYLKGTGFITPGSPAPVIVPEVIAGPAVVNAIPVQTDAENNAALQNKLVEMENAGAAEKDADIPF